MDNGTIDDLAGPHIIFTGANVHIRSGSGYTDDAPNGLGNLIVGYNENPWTYARTGSHNMVIGPEHGYSSYGGFVAGVRNRISGVDSSVSGGRFNQANGNQSSVSGGLSKTATANSCLVGDSVNC